jgi:hypothetical protein
MQPLLRYASHFLAILALLWSGAALADVRVHFHSFDGSVLFGSRYPHAFVVLEGTLDDGTVVNENYGFSARRVTPAILSGPVEHIVMTESAKSVASTNRHFTLTVDDRDYAKVIALVRSWQNAPGRFYDLDTRNCIHFVGEIAKVLGVRVTYPDNMLRRPKKWLNHVASLNPALGAARVD